MDRRQILRGVENVAVFLYAGAWLGSLPLIVGAGIGANGVKHDRAEKEKIDLIVKKQPGQEALKCIGNKALEFTVNNQRFRIPTEHCNLTDYKP